MYRKSTIDFIYFNSLNISQFEFFTLLKIFEGKEFRRKNKTRMEQHVKFWNQCLHIIEEVIGEPMYSTWFIPIVPLSYVDNNFTIQVPSQFFYEYIEEQFADLLHKTLNRVINSDVKLLYRIKIDNSENNDRGSITLPPESSSVFDNRQTTLPQVETPFTTVERKSFDPQLNRNYNFANYIEGASNRLGRSAGLNIADQPGRSIFNPIFIWGASAVGKTHLANAIGLAVKERYPEKRVLYVSANLFQMQYSDAVCRNQSNDFLNFYQSIDVLIIDDIQELSGKTKTQNTFFHIFNHLHQNRKQLIMSCDRHPKDLKDIEERMITRFKWGLVTELEKPDLKLRKDILRDKTSRDGLVVNDEVIDYAAENITGSVRDLEGFIASLMAHSTFYNKEINLELTQDILNKNSKKEEKPITIESIINTVCDYYDVDIDAIQTKSRKHEVVQVRQISMYLAKKHLDFSTSKIGAYIGKRDHATVLHACNMVKDQLQVDKNFRKDMENIESSLKS